MQVNTLKLTREHWYALPYNTLTNNARPFMNAYNSCEGGNSTSKCNKSYRLAFHHRYDAIQDTLPDPVTATATAAAAVARNQGPV